MTSDGTPPTGPTPRLRDRLGRPLRRDTDPRNAVAPVPERTTITARDALAEADGYLARGLPFHAHEVLEQRWRCAPEPERPLWRALAQWAAAITHRARGNERGAHAVAARAARGLRSYGGPDVRGVDPDGRSWALDIDAVRRSCTDLLDSGGAPMRPAVRLLRGSAEE